MGMTNGTSNSFFKNIVDGANEALIFVSPNAENTLIQKKVFRIR